VPSAGTQSITLPSGIGISWWPTMIVFQRPCARTAPGRMSSRYQSCTSPLVGESLTITVCWPQSMTLSTALQPSAGSVPSSSLIAIARIRVSVELG
jgi:hypothetical protein